MALFFYPVPKIVRLREVILAACPTIEELRFWGDKLRNDGCSVDEPPKKNTLKSKTLPRLLITGLEVSEMPGCPVAREYLPVLNWLARKDFYLNYSSDEADPEAVKRLDAEIRAKVIALAKAEEVGDSGGMVPVVDLDTERSELVRLHKQLEKIDLGRRSDLKLGYPMSRRSRDLNHSFHHVEAIKKREAARQASEMKSIRGKVAREEDTELTPFQRALLEGKVPGMG